MILGSAANGNFEGLIPSIISKNNREVRERLKRLAWKASKPFTRFRGFEFHPLGKLYQ